MTDLLALLGVAAIAFTLFRIAVPVSTDRTPDTLIGPASGASAAHLLDIAAAYVNAPVSVGNRVDLLRNGDEIFPAMLGAIESAEREVHLLTYVYWTGKIADRFASALSISAARGVTTRVLLDAYGASSMNRALVRRMERAGVDVQWFHPVKRLDPRRLNNRTHRKVLVVDGRVGFAGGVGIAQEWAGDAQNRDQWRDDHFRVRGPVVRALQGAFVEEWLSATGRVLADPASFPDLVPRGEARILPVFTSPRARWSPVAFCFWWLAHHATGTLDIATPYYLPDDEVAAALHAAARRGVRVRLLLPNDHNDSRLVRWAAHANYPGLLGAGVEVYEFQPTMMHTKAAVADGRFALVGSANMDHRSFALNDEIVLLVDDAGTAKTIHRSFEEDLKRSRKIDADHRGAPNAAQRALAGLASSLKSQL